MTVSRKLFGNLSWSRAREALLATSIFGILAHGFMLFNKFSWHDDSVYGFGVLPVELPLSMGRWFRALLSTAVAKFFGGSHMSLPLFYGVASILFIALSAYLIIEIFDIQNKIYRIMLCGVMVCFPVVTSIFAYMFTAPYYFLGLFLSVAAVYISARESSLIRFLLSSLCICLCLGLYQAFISVPVSLFVLLLIYGIANGEYPSLGALIKRGLFLLAICAFAMAAYYAVSRVAMKLRNIAPADYQGFSAIGDSGVRAFLHSILRTYKAFFLISFELPYENLYPAGIAVVQRITILIGAVFAVMIAVRQFKKSVSQGIIMTLLLISLPACFNLIYIVCAITPTSKIHTLMLYGQTMLYVFVIIAMDRQAGEKRNFQWGMTKAVALSLVVLILSNIYFDNTCYLKAEMAQQQTISNLTVLVTRIKSLPGYNDKMPVCYILEGKRDATVTTEPWYSLVGIMPYTDNLMLMPHHHDSGRNLKNYLEDWCGFNPKQAKTRDFKDLEEVKDMPDYPDDGSIRIINDTVVVKM